MASRNLKIIVSALAAMAVAACAPVSKVSDKKPEEVRQLVFPAPPDEPRFVFERTIRGSGDVVPETEENALRRALTGEGSNTERLGKPYAVATYHGRIFVSDSAKRYIHVFDIPKATYSKIGQDDGDGQLVKPLGLDVDAAGNLYVADATAKAIVIYDNAGKFLRKIGGSKFFDRLTSVTVDPKGERVYVVDIGGVLSENHRVRMFDARTGAHLGDIGKRGTGQGEFNLPRDMAIGKDGRLYVVDGGNFRVQVFDRDGKFLKSFGEVGKQLGNFSRPKEIAADRDGNVYVVDAAFGNYQIFSAEGELLMFVGDRSEQDKPAGYMLPSGISVDADGRVYFVDQWFRKLDVFRPYALKPNEGFLVISAPVATK